MTTKQQIPLTDENLSPPALIRAGRDAAMRCCPLAAPRGEGIGRYGGSCTEVRISSILSVCGEIKENRQAAKISSTACPPTALPKILEMSRDAVPQSDAAGDGASRGVGCRHPFVFVFAGQRH